MEDKYSYIFTEKAENDLDGILQYISVNLSNKSAANLFIDKVFAEIEVLRAFPSSGMLVNNGFISEEVHRVLVDNYTIYYSYNTIKKEIHILRIVYSKRDMNKILNEL